MKPSRDFWCEACESACKLPADTDSIPPCPNCFRKNSLVLVNAPDGSPVTPQIAAKLFHEMRKQISADE
jgi:hypothetical protein